MKKIIVFSILITITVAKCIAQDKGDSKKVNTNLSFINNTNINYSIILESCDTCTPISNRGYRVVVKLTQQEKDQLKKINCETWIELLNNKSKDWAANLILYDLFDKDALLLSKRDSRKLWIENLKSDDVKFWKKTICNGNLH